MEGIDISKYRVNIPYPSVKIDKHNKKYARLLLDDYAGSASEFTAITDYIYAHVLAENVDISETFLGIAMVEMTHLDMLADAIVGFGINPKFRNGNNDFWKGEFTNYERSTKKRIKIAIKSEKGAIEQYLKHIKMIKQKDVKELLQRIILDEQLHIQLFESLLNKYYYK